MLQGIFAKTRVFSSLNTDSNTDSNTDMMPSYGLRPQSRVCLCIRVHVCTRARAVSVRVRQSFRAGRVQIVTTYFYQAHSESSLRGQLTVPVIVEEEHIIFHNIKECCRKEDSLLITLLPFHYLPIHSQVLPEL